jgi:hypothetical protein
MASSISFDSFTSWLGSSDSLRNESLTLAQFMPDGAGGQTPAPSSGAPLIPQIALDPANPNRLQAQRGVVDVNVFSGLEHGARTETHAIVLHMTGGTAASTLETYRNTEVGAHFLIARDGTITQTAGLDQVAWHVGNPRPKGYLPTADGGNRRVDADLTPESEAILNGMAAGNPKFGTGIRQLAALENAKPYGNDRADETTRGPINRDSIGIEFEAVPVDGVYPVLTDAQRASGLALLDLLKSRYGLTSADVYEHPDVSYKTYSEARGAKQQIEYYTGD